MKSDWDDAPYYLRNPKKSSERRTMLIAGLFGAALTSAGLYFASAKIDSNEPLPHAATTELAQPQPEVLPPLEELVPNQPTAEERFWSSVNRDAANRSAEIKQTDYNDANYAPQQAANVVSMEPVRQSSAYQAANSGSSVRQREVEYDQVWVEKWGGGGRYLAAWTVIDNRIDGRSVCANHQRGSIDYRECRKGAKQHFKDECRLWDERWGNNQHPYNQRLKQRFCSAANSFSPMG